MTIQTVFSDGTIGPIVKTKSDIRVHDTTLVDLQENEPGSFQLTAKRSGSTTLSIECNLIDGKHRIDPFAMGSVGVCGGVVLKRAIVFKIYDAVDAVAREYGFLGAVVECCGIVDE